MRKISKQKISEIYAKALADAGHDSDQAKSLYEQANLLHKIFSENRKICEYFSSPLFSLEDKQDTLLSLVKEQNLLPIMQRFLQIVLENNRFADINTILEEFTKKYMEDSGYIYVTVKSVKELSKKQDKDLQNNLKKLLSKEVIIKYEIKPEILGGLIIQYDSNIIDDSIQNKISIIEKAMKGA